MTIGDYRGGSVTPAPAAVQNASAAPAKEQSSRQASVPNEGRKLSNAMPPPTQRASVNSSREAPSQRPQRPSPPPPKASLDHESLFLSAADDDDRQWGESNYNNDQDTVGWDANVENVSE